MEEQVVVHQNMHRVARHVQHCILKRHHCRLAGGLIPGEHGAHVVGLRWRHGQGGDAHGRGLERGVQRHQPLHGRRHQVGDRRPEWNVTDLGQVRASARDQVGKEGDRSILVGRVPDRLVLHVLQRRAQPGAHLGRVWPGQNGHDLAREQAGRMARPGIEGAGVDHLHVGHLGRLVDGDVGRVVVVGRDQADGALLRAQAQFLGKVAIHVGNQAHGQGGGVNRIQDAH